MVDDWVAARLCTFLTRNGIGWSGFGLCVHR
jgi:hypothetical protein